MNKEYRCSNCDFSEIVKDESVVIWQRCPLCNEGYIYLYKLNGELQVPKKEAERE